jgi:hypothetical protein
LFKFGDLWFNLAVNSYSKDNRLNVSESSNLIFSVGTSMSAQSFLFLHKYFVSESSSLVSHASWVQNDGNQFGLYLFRVVLVRDLF